MSRSKTTFDACGPRSQTVLRVHVPRIQSCRGVRLSGSRRRRVDRPSLNHKVTNLDSLPQLKSCMPVPHQWNDSCIVHSLLASSIDYTSVPDAIGERERARERNPAPSRENSRCVSCFMFHRTHGRQQAAEQSRSPFQKPAVVTHSLCMRYADRRRSADSPSVREEWEKKIGL